MKPPIAPDLMERYDSREAVDVDGETVIEFRAVDPLENEPGFDGYITTWWTVDDRASCFAPGAFRKSLKERVKEAPVLFGHDFYTRVQIGLHDVAGTKEDDKGVLIRALINEGTQMGAEVMSALRFAKKHGRRGLGMSFGFDTVRERSAKETDKLDMSVAPEWVKSLPKTDIRVKEEVRFWESSVLQWGANDKAGPTKVRGLNPHELRAMIEAVKAGELVEDQIAALTELVAVWGETRSAGAGQNHATPQPTTIKGRNLEAELALLALDLPDEIRGLLVA